MLANRISRIQRLTARSRRYSSHAQTTYPFTKLRAYPFRISAEDAIVQLAPYASYLCMFQQLFGSLAARLLPGFGFKPFRPVQIIPVYFPGWLIDAEVSADFELGNVQHRASGVTKDSYLPGSDFRVLSRIAYRSNPAADAVPFTDELTHQYGVDVTCIPYTISPFAGFDLAKSVTDPIELRENISFIPSSIRSSMFAAYPVLFPLYLAQYECPFPGKEILVTLFIEAAAPGGRIWCEHPGLVNDMHENYPLPTFLTKVINAVEKIGVPIIRGVPLPFFRFSGFESGEKEKIAPLVKRWVNRALVAHSTGPNLVDKSGIITSDDDPRIRPFTVEEQKVVQTWLRFSEQIEAMTTIVETLRRTSSLKPSQMDDWSLKPIESLEQTISNLKTAQEGLVPHWWKEHRSKKL